ncbi:MAG TPA: hypothetical protein PLS03_00545 [Terrimicrobiaceae bacterium]|nr:hypothetical protein [Terrimicrobiaceae bacterium]
MKALFRTLVAVALAVAPARGAEIGLRPDDKKPVPVAADERNPFGRIAPKAPEAVAVEVESEESKIRAMVSGLPVSGYTEGNGQKKVLMGPYVLDPGKDLPQLIRGQTETVRVVSVDEDKVELGFVEKDGKIAGRTMVLKIDIAPVVRFRLGGDAGAPDGDAAAAAAAEAALGGVIKKDHAPAPSSK